MPTSKSRTAAPSPISPPATATNSRASGGKRARSAAREGGASSLAFAEVLQNEQTADATKRKGERTRDRLLLAAVRALEARGYHALRVRDICEGASVSPAAFYQYFDNVREITVEVLSSFLRNSFTSARTTTGPRAPFESIYAANLVWVTSARANAGLVRCLLQLGDEVPEFKALHEQLNHEWFVLVTHGLQRRFPAARRDEPSLLLAVHALGGMMDEIARKVLVAREEHLQPIVEAVAPSDEALAEFLSVIWYRALFGSEPRGVRLRAGRDLLRLGRGAPRLRLPRGR